MDKIQNILWQAKYHRNRNWLQVRALLKNGLNEFRDNKELLLALAELYMSKKLFRKAIEQYHRVLEQNENDESVIFQIGNCFLSLREFRLALDYYNRIPDGYPELLYNKAFSYSKLGKTKKSIEILQELLKYKINSELPFVFLAELCFSQKNYKDAIEYINKAEELFGKKGSICYLRGLAYFQLGNWLNAYVEFYDALKLKVNSSHFYRNFGLTCEKIGKTLEAVNYLLQSIKLAPMEPVNYIELIRLYLAHNRFMEAYSMVQLAKKNVPFSITLSMLYNQIMDKVNRSKKS